MYTAKQMCEIGYTRVDKRVARRLYDSGEDIYVVPCNCSVRGNFTVVIDKPTWDRTFDSLINEFERYNCDPVRGAYPMFFIKDPA